MLYVEEIQESEGLYCRLPTGVSHEVFKNSRKVTENNCTVLSLELGLTSAPFSSVWLQKYNNYQNVIKSTLSVPV